MFASSFRSRSSSVSEWLDEAEELSNELDELSNAVLDCWVFFDRPLPDRRLVVDALLAEDKSVGRGERDFLSAMRQPELAAIVERAYRLTTTRAVRLR